MATCHSHFVRIRWRTWNLWAKNCWKKAQKWQKNQFLDFWYNRVRLPGGLIFGLLASLGSYGHRTMLGIFVQYFLYQSQFWTAESNYCRDNECLGGCNFFGDVNIEKEEPSSVVVNEKCLFIPVSASFYSRQQSQQVKESLTCIKYANHCTTLVGELLFCGWLFHLPRSLLLGSGRLTLSLSYHLALAFGKGGHLLQSNQVPRRS